LAGNASGTGTAFARKDRSTTAGDGGDDPSVAPADGEDFEWWEWFWLVQGSPASDLALPVPEASWDATWEATAPRTEHLEAPILASWRDDSPRRQPDDSTRSDSPRSLGAQSWNRACEALFAEETPRTAVQDESQLCLYPADGLSGTTDRLFVPSALALLLAGGNSRRRREANRLDVALNKSSGAEA
jgi:hypothetical protein